MRPLITWPPSHGYLGVFINSERSASGRSRQKKPFALGPTPLSRQVLESQQGWQLDSDFEVSSLFAIVAFAA